MRTCTRSTNHSVSVRTLAIAGMLLAMGIAPTTHATDIVLRDGLGDPPVGAGINAIPSGYRVDQVPAATNFPVETIIIPSDVELRQLVVPVARISTLGSIYAQSFRVRLWPTLESAGQNPWAGTLVDAGVAPVIEPWGTLPNGKPRYIVTFDLTPLHITLPPGPVYFSLGVITPNSPSGLHGVLESLIQTGAPVDSVVSQALPAPGYVSICNGPPPSGGACQYTGNFAFRLTAAGLSTCAGDAGCPADYDANGGVDGGDLAAFFTDYEAGAPCSDVDQNGGVDGADLAAFFLVYEAGGC